MMITKSQMALRAQLYTLLTRLYRSEVDAALLEKLKGLSFPAAGNELLAQGYAMLTAYLSDCGENALTDLAVDYATVFLAAGSATGRAAIPCESLYTSPRKIFMQEAWEDVCRIYAQAGLGKGSTYDDMMEDHLALELEFMAYLVKNGNPESQLSFLDTHLLNWVGEFMADIDKYAALDFYKATGRITLGFLQMERELLTALQDGSLLQASSYSVRADRMANVFARLKEKYRLFAPKRFPKRGPNGTDLIRYGEIGDFSEIVYQEKSHFSPKEVFYPISQTMFYFKGDHCTEKELEEEEKEIILFARPCDIHAIRRLDNIFLNNGQPDLYYSRMREKLHIFMLECRDGFDNCFCASMGSNFTEEYSVAFRIDDICALVEVRDEAFLPYFIDEVPIDFTPSYVQENKRTARVPQIAREKLGEVCKLAYWAQYDQQCIGCGGCNTVCPTCSCFDTVDVIYDETSLDGERRRVWSSCMLSDFTRTAGGGMARKTPGANMRFKVLHKVFDYAQRFGEGEHMCVGCGRCIDRCPKKIDYLDTVNGLTEVLEKEGF